MAVTYSFSSGKGGVGKSVLTAGIGMALAEEGASVVIVDADIGLRSQDAMLSLENQVVYDLIDLQNRNCTPEQVLLSVPGFKSLKLLPAAQFVRTKALEPKHFRKILEQLKEKHDFVLVDCPAGIERGFRNVLNAGVDLPVLVVTPDDLCIRDAERAAQVMEQKACNRPYLIVNRLDNRLIRSKDMYSARVVAQTLDLPLLGEVPEDPVIYQAFLKHRHFYCYECEARGAVVRIASRMKGNPAPFPEYGKQRIPWLKKRFSPVLREVVPLDDQ